MPGVRPGALLGHTPGLWTPPNAAVAAPAGYAATVLATPGLLSFYRHNESAGPTMTDATGLNTGSYVGTPTFSVAGPTTDGATGITIPATDGSYGLAKTSKILAGLTNWTIEAMVKTSIVGGGPGSCIYAERNAAAGNDILKFEETAGAGTLRLTYRDDAATLNQILSTGTINNGVWRQVAVVKSGTAVTFVIDGASAGGGGALTATNTFTDVLRCQIGDDPVGGTTPFNGSIADVSLYNVAVPLATLTAHWNAR